MDRDADDVADLFETAVNVQFVLTSNDAKSSQVGQAIAKFKDFATRVFIV